MRLVELAPRFFKVADSMKLSKRKRQERIEPLYDRYHEPNSWRLSKRRAWFFFFSFLFCSVLVQSSMKCPLFVIVKRHIFGQSKAICQLEHFFHVSFFPIWPVIVFTQVGSIKVSLKSGYNPSVMCFCKGNYSWIELQFFPVLRMDCWNDPWTTFWQ